jgi:hypothetical protein
MGALMPVGGGPDKEICDTLNTLFSGADLTALRNHLATENLFDGNHRLGRVAARIGAFPARDYGADQAKRKWFYFLDRVLTQATKDAIKRILSDTLTQTVNNVKGANFSVEENSAVTNAHLYPSNSEPLANYLDSTKNYYLVHMVVKQPLDDQHGEDPPANNDTDPQGNNVETPIQWPKLRPSRRKFSRRRSRN